MEEAKNHSYEEIDLKEYLHLLFKWKWTIILFVIAAVMTSYIISKYFLTPVYETQAVFMVSQPEAQKSYTNSGDSLENSVESFSPTPVLTMNSFVAQFQNAEMLEQVLLETGLQDQYTYRGLAGKMDVKGDSETGMLVVKIMDSNPLLAANLMNSLVDNFYKFSFISNQNQMSDTVTYLNERLAETRGHLEELARTYQEGKAQARNSDVLSMELSNKNRIISNYRETILQSQIELQQLLAGKTQLEKSLSNTPMKFSNSRSWEESSLAGIVTMNDPNNTQMISEEEINPVYLELVQSLNNSDRSIAEKRAQITSLTEAVNTLQKEIVVLQEELMEKQLKESTMKRELDSLENAYTVLNDKIIQTEILKTADFAKNNVILISPAYVPVKPAKPNVGLNMAIAGVLGLMLAVLLILVIDYFDDTIKNEEDIKKYTGLPVLGNIPHGN